MRRRVNADYTGIQSSKGKEEEDQCYYLKSVIEKLDGDGDIKDFKCNVKSCDTDLCTASAQAGNTVINSLCVLAFVFQTAFS